jgi:pimeloyl-ACP methyl ester carboxylesterase
MQHFVKRVAITFIWGMMLLLALTQPSHGAQKLDAPKEVAFTAAVDGSTQLYMEMLPAGFDQEQEHHVLIALHGHGANRHQYASDTRDECRAARDMAAKYDMIFISPDYRASTSWMGPTAEADLVQIISDLRNKYRVGKIFLVGASMGGASALTFAALHPELIAGVASQNGTANHLEYANFQDAISASYGGRKQQIPEEYKKRSAEYWPERFTMPVAIAAGGADTLVPAASVVRLANILNQLGRKVLLIYREQGGHSTDYVDTTATLEYVICTALNLPLHHAGAIAQAGGVFFGGQRPSITDAGGKVDLGLKVTATTTGVITAVYFFKAQGEVENSHTLRIWDAQGQCVLSHVTQEETGGGWQRAVLPTPFAVKADDVYTISYTAQSHYPAHPGAFAAPIVREGITAFAGTYSFEEFGKAMPVKTHQQMSYGIDIEYTATHP